jgi:peptide-methionine (S)-S-oxide reductase
MRGLPVFTILLATLISCGSGNTNKLTNSDTTYTVALDTTGLKKAYFASGCFWCVEAIYESVIGVSEAVSGFAGGNASDATYDKVSAGLTEHAETVLVYYNPALVSYETLLTVFFDSHDPTTLNRQGPDSGYQYRSAVFYATETEKQQALDVIKKIDDSGIYDVPVVTQVVPFTGFYPAEEYHQDYKRRNPNQSYVRAVSAPRLENFKKKRPEVLKSDTIKPE